MKRLPPTPPNADPETYTIRLVMRVPHRPGAPVYLRHGEQPVRIEVERATRLEGKRKRSGRAGR